VVYVRFIKASRKEEPGIAPLSCLKKVTGEKETVLGRPNRELLMVLNSASAVATSI
jgi:hypothetical protein